jgi:predicted transcriptional regulator
MNLNRSRTIRLSKAWDTQISSYADQWRVSTSYVMRTAILEWLNRNAKHQSQLSR